MSRIRLLLFLLLFSGIGLFCGVFLFFTTNRWLDLSALEQGAAGHPSILLDDEGKEWGRFQLERKEPISLSSLSRLTIEAFLTSEDQEFFIHHGISLRGILRAIKTNLRQHRFAQGASTITQQLVRLLFVSKERTLWRKIREQVLSLLIEQQFSKEQILEAYLNNVYFGTGIYGIQAAAKRFWGIEAKDLSIAQSALLTGLLPSPERYSPITHEEIAKGRREVVLRSMLNRKTITKQQYDAALQEPLNIRHEPSSALAPHFREWLRRMLEEQFDRKTLYTGGLIIQTTLNRKAQEKADQVFKEHIKHLRSVEPKLDGALVCIDNATAGIKALVGGYDFMVSQYNKATQATRQMGSMFKPIIYTTALLNGSTMQDTEKDEPLVIGTWAPQNVSKDFIGTMTFAHAVTVSNNIIPVKLFFKLGAERISECAQKFHLPGPFPPYPSLALGCTECTPLQAAAYFAVYPNKGVYTEPHAIEWIKDEWGQKIWKYYAHSDTVIDWSTASQMLQVLRLVSARLRERMPEHWIRGDTAGKTGTTNDNRTCWFAGCTPTHTSVVYLGRDDNEPMEHRIFSAWHALPLWLDFNYFIENPKKTFYFDPQLSRIWVNRFSGAPSREGAADAIPLLTK
ncbi:MAG: Penicillin-binding protein, 1A family [candidate division TM6 bacterium GW2011_GWE2_42_60]|nr:MAG: Penicillin-binding protein, 1A family [candidate division TM6 bacterium GW2011_GWE2_42_60]HBY05627.1 hypothetical protein [Candidatus Dependentiae bacterium]